MPDHVEYKRNDSLIIDVGTCEGNDTWFYLRKGFEVISVEANTRTEAGLQVRFADEIASGRLHVFNRAAGSRSGDKVSVWDTPDPGHSTVNSNPHNAGNSFEVTTIDWPELVATRGIPHYVKIDIEGMEHDFLMSMLQTTARAEFISVECHTMDNIAMLFAMGYRKFKIINQTSLFLNTIPNPAERRRLRR